MVTIGEPNRFEDLFRAVVETSKQKQSVYEIDDCFLRFWFRFIWKNAYLRELQRFDVLQDIATRDFDVFSSSALERYFYCKFMEEKRYTRMDAWWDRKGENEIDLVCEDSAGNKLAICDLIIRTGKTHGRRKI